MELELLQYLPGGGSVAALIITVILFLKTQERQQEKTHENLNSIADKFNSQVAASQITFNEQIASLTTQSRENQRVYQEQVQSLIDGHMDVAKETISAIKGLESAVRELKAIVQSPARRPPPPANRRSASES